MPLVHAMDGRAIKIGRAFANLSQRQLACATGLTVHRIWALENNISQARPDEVGRILNALSTGVQRVAVSPEATE